jgi:hypothetical protein
MPKVHVSMPKLQRRAMSEVRKQPGCHNGQEISIALQSTLKITGRSVCLQRARQMPIPPHARRFTSKLSCAGSMIC